MNTNALALQPWKLAHDVIGYWARFMDAFIKGFYPPTVSSQAARDRAVEQLKQVQWRLSQRYTVSRKLPAPASLEEEGEQFLHWSLEYSENFRHLLLPYQYDWFVRYTNLMLAVPPEDQWSYHSPELEQLLLEIELHLYQ